MEFQYEDIYFFWLSNQATIEQLKTQIKTMLNNDTGIEAVNIVLESLEKYKKELISLINESINADDLVMFKEELSKLEEKIEVINNELNYEFSKQNYEQKLEQFGNSGVLFATNKYGNIMIEKDLKTIKSNCSKEVYNSFIEMIDDLINNVNYSNNTKQKVFNSGNDLSKGLYERKNYQSRLLYRYSGSKVVVIGASIKKDDFAFKYRSFCINCKEKSQKYVDDIEKGKININFLMQQSTEFYDKIIKEKGEKTSG